MQRACLFVRWLDINRALDLAQEINGVPRAIFRRDEAAQAQGLIELP